MRIAHRIEIAAPRELVWEHIVDQELALRYMSGVTRWEVEGEQRAGLGTRLRVLMRVGAAEVGGLIEIVEWREPTDLAWASITGIDQRGRWRLRESNGRTRAEMRFSYGIAGAGLSGWLSERLAARTVSRHIRRTLAQLKRIVEQEQMRRQAEERRAARQAGRQPT